MTLSPTAKCDCLPWPDRVGGQVVSVHQDSCALLQDAYYLERQYEFRRARELERAALDALAQSPEALNDFAQRDDVSED